MRPLPAVVYRENSLGPPPGQGMVNGLVIFLAICVILYAGAGILIPVALAVLLAPHGVAAESAVAVGLLWLASQIVTGLVGGGLFLIDRQAALPDAEHQ